MGYVYPKGNFSHFVDFVTLSVHVFHLDFSFFLNILTFLRFKETYLFLLQFYFFRNIKIFRFLIETSKSCIKKSYFLYPQKTNVHA